MTTFSCGEEHNERLRATLERARECNLKFKLEKCHFRSTSVGYIGHKLTPEGIKPDPEKIEAIVNMPEPHDKGFQRLLGMVNYVSKFVPNMSEITSPLRELFKKDVTWHWSVRHARAFEKIKTSLANPEPGVLTYYDVTKPVKLQVDASKSGLGAVLIPSDMPCCICLEISNAGGNQICSDRKRTLGSYYFLLSI